MFEQLTELFKVWWYNRKAKVSYKTYCKSCELGIRSADEFNESMEKLKALGVNLGSKRIKFPSRQ